MAFEFGEISCHAGRGDSEEEVGLGRPVSQADFEGAMKLVGPSITRGSEVQVSPGRWQPL